jgi:hypothetical protein
MTGMLISPAVETHFFATSQRRNGKSSNKKRLLA